METALLEQRIAELEAAQRASEVRRRRGRRTLGVLGLCFCALGAVSQDFPLVVKTRRLEILDEAGRVVLAATSGSNGGALQLFDSSGQTVAVLRAGQRDGGLYLYAPTGRPLASLSAGPFGGAARLHHKSGEVVASVGANGPGGALQLSDALAANRLELEAGPERSVARFHHADQERLVLEGNADGSRAELFGADGRRALRLDAAPEGPRVALVARDSEHAWPAFDLTATAEGTELLLAATQGRSGLRARADASGSFLALERENVNAFRVESVGVRVGLWLLDLAGQEVFGVSSRLAGGGDPPATTTGAVGAEPEPLTEEAEIAKRRAELAADRAKEKLQSWQPTDPEILKNPRKAAELKHRRQQAQEKGKGGKAGGQRRPK